MTVDPRNLPASRQGTALRDAAVNPLAGDFLEPTNAGAAGPLGNPHGPHVVNPEIHGLEEVRTITPGAVSPVAATQEAAAVASLKARHKIPGAFAGTTAVALGVRVLLADGTTILEVTTAGTTAAGAPTAPGAVGGTVVSGTATFTRRV